MVKRLNVGCGQTPTAGFENYDNSWSIRLANSPMLLFLARRWLDENQRQFTAFARFSGIRWADVTRRIPEQDGSVEVLYSSHMLEHLDARQATQFLKEARRVLASGGIIRLAVPNIFYHIHNYLQNSDADRFVDSTNLVRPRPAAFFDKLKYLVIGDRQHQWMYDGESLCRLLARAGFVNAQVMEAGTTMIRDPGMLDLSERYPESVFVEALNP